MLYNSSVTSSYLSQSHSRSEQTGFNKNLDFTVYTKSSAYRTWRITITYNSRVIIILQAKEDVVSLCLLRDFTGRKFSDKFCWFLVISTVLNQVLLSHTKQHQDSECVSDDWAILGCVDYSVSNPQIPKCKVSFTRKLMKGIHPLLLTVASLKYPKWKKKSCLKL